MGAAALALRASPRRPPQRARTPATLAFDQVGGPVVAVCGLVGGSGASTLALSLAERAALDSRAPILLTEADPQRASLAAMAQRASASSLAALAAHAPEERLAGPPFTQIAPRLRLLASPPHPDPGAVEPDVRRVIDHAREAHGLVVIDCGTSWTSDDATLAQATHILWTLAATPVALARAQALWESELAPTPGSRREALVASDITGRAKISVRSLRRLAAARCERLVIVPFDSGYAADPRGHGAGSRHPLVGLAPLLRACVR